MDVAIAEGRPFETCGLKTMLTARACFYTLCFKAMGATPTFELFELLASDGLRAAVRPYAAEDETMAKFLRFLHRLSSQVAEEGPKILADKAKDEYVRLFIGPAALPAQPLETPYAAHEMAMLSRNSLLVREIYARFGLRPVRLNHEPDDHVSTMCGFMSYLSCELAERFEGNEAASGSSHVVENLLQEQGRFSLEHMANWLPDFARGQSKVAAPVLYPQLSAALSSFVLLDAVGLSRVLRWMREIGDAVFVPECSDAQDGALLEETLAALEAYRPSELIDHALERSIA